MLSFFCLFVKAFDYFSVHCMPSDHDTNWMYISSVLSTKGSAKRCCLTFRLLNYFCDTDCVRHVLHLAETATEWWSEEKCEGHKTSVVGFDSSLHSIQNSTSTCGLCFLTLWKQNLFVSSSSVCPWAKNKVSNSHLSPSQICFMLKDLISLIL